MLLLLLLFVLFDSGDDLVIVTKLVAASDFGLFELVSVVFSVCVGEDDDDGCSVCCFCVDDLVGLFDPSWVSFFGCEEDDGIESSTSDDGGFGGFFVIPLLFVVSDVVVCCFVCWSDAERKKLRRNFDLHTFLGN